MGDGLKMKDAVRAAAERHIDRQGVEKGLDGHDVPRTDAPRQKVHDRRPGRLGQPDPTGINGRNGAVPGQGHAQRLGQTVHAVGREHAGAGAAAGTGPLLDLAELPVAQPAVLERPDRLEHGVEVQSPLPDPAGEHRAPAHQDGRDVDPGRGHQHSRRDLVAIRDQDQGVELVGLGHGLDRVGDELPAGQGIVHSHVAHGQAVADPDRRELHRGPAGGEHPGPDRRRDPVKLDMARDELVPGVDDADPRRGDLSLGVPHRPQQRTMRRPLRSILDVVARHGYPSDTDSPLVRVWSRKAAVSCLVTGPGRKSPISRPSTLETGTISAAVPVRKHSSAA